MTESGLWVRRIACGDQAGRERDLELFFSAQDDLVLRVPAGEVAVLRPGQILQFRHVLDEAHIEAIARRSRP